MIGPTQAWSGRLLPDDRANPQILWNSAASVAASLIMTELCEPQYKMKLWWTRAVQLNVPAEHRDAGFTAVKAITSGCPPATHVLCASLRRRQQGRPISVC